MTAAYERVLGEAGRYKAEADRLRAERNQYDERGYEAQLEIDRLRGVSEGCNVCEESDARSVHQTADDLEHEARQLRAREGDDGE